MMRPLQNGNFFAAVSAVLIFNAAHVAAAPTFANAVTNGIVDIPLLKEASGIAESRNNANVIWTENDSGNAAVVYAIDTHKANGDLLLLLSTSALITLIMDSISIDFLCFCKSPFVMRTDSMPNASSCFL